MLPASRSFPPKGCSVQRGFSTCLTAHGYLGLSNEKAPPGGPTRLVLFLDRGLSRIIHRAVGLGHSCDICGMERGFVDGANTGPPFPQVGRRPGVAKFKFAQGLTGVRRSG